MASVATSSTASAGSSGGTQDITLKSYLQLIGDPTAGINSLCDSLFQFYILGSYQETFFPLFIEPDF